MRTFTARLTGLLLVLGAILGTITAGAGLVMLWRAEPVLTETIDGTIDLMDTTLTTTADTMLFVNGSLLQMKDNLGVIRESLQNAGSAMQSTADVTSSVAGLIGDDFTNVVNETQQSLASVQNSARMIDNTLSLISGIPLIGPSLSGGYRRDMPLEGSIREVSTSLETVPASLRDVQNNLQTTSQNFELMKSDLEKLAATIDEIESGLANAETMMGDYQELFTRSQERLDNARTASPTLVRSMLLLGTAFFIWLLVAQIAMFLQGLDLLTWNRVVISPHRAELTERNPE
jgi:methyl-accepting chemotaxis protein